MGTKVISVSACSALPFSNFWEFSGCVGPCVCAPAGIAINPLQQKISNAQNPATNALQDGCDARYLNLAPTSAAGLPWLWAALQVAGGDSITRVPQCKRHLSLLCNFRAFRPEPRSAEFSAFGSTINVKMPALAKGEQPRCQIPARPQSW